MKSIHIDCRNGDWLKVSETYSEDNDDLELRIRDDDAEDTEVTLSRENAVELMQFLQYVLGE